MTHALEADHVAAVATLLEGEEAVPAAVGALWGLGHTVPVTLLGLAFVALGAGLPGAVLAVGGSAASVLEVGAGVVGVAVGIALLASVAGIGLPAAP